jgi:hypothetical protein
MSRSWLRLLAKPQSRRSGPGRAAPRCRLGVERLEDRCLLTGNLSVVPFTSLFPQPVEGSSFTGQIATVFDTGPLTPTFRVSINWGDGTATDTTTGTVTAITGSPNAFTVNGTHTYAEESSSVTPPFNTTIMVTVSDTANSLGPITVSGSTSVADANLSQGNPITATPTVFQGGGTGQPTAATAQANFRAAIGGVNNGAATQPFASGFRAINWDGVRVDGTDFGGGANTTVIRQGSVVGIPLNRFQTNGVYFGAINAVSGADASGNTFTTVNPSVAGLFPPLSRPNTFAMFNDNGIDFKFVLPSPADSTVVSAATRGFGAIFENVEIANTTSIQYFNGNTLLATVFAPVSGRGGQSFVGALFNSAIVTRAVLTLGTDVIFTFDGTNTRPGPFTDDGVTHNLVTTDDWTLAEPVPTPNGLPIVTGAQGTTFAAGTVTAVPGLSFTGVVASFSDLDPNGNARDFTATINWGDGRSTNGAIAANGQGGFNVVGTHTYGAPGVFPINVDIADFGGGPGLSGSIPTVSVNNTAYVGNANQRFLIQVYNDLLKRTIDPIGMSFWDGQLEAGVSRTSVVQQIEKSQEFLNDEVQVLFQHYLGRAADAMGLSFFSGFLAGNNTLEQAAAMIVGSPEYFNGKGRGNNTGWLAAFFQDALGRAPDATAMSVFGGQLNAGTPLSTVASQVYASAEYQRRTVDIFFQDFVRRHVDAGGSAFFVGFYAAGVVGGSDPDQRIIAGLLASPEYDGKLQANTPILPVSPLDLLAPSLP